MSTWTATVTDAAGHPTTSTVSVSPVTSAAKTVLGSSGKASLLPGEVDPFPRFDLVLHDYTTWDVNPDPVGILQNIKMARTGTGVDANHLWEEIAAGQEDARARAIAKFLREHDPRFVIFGHEPRPTQGTSASFRAAYEHLVPLLRSEGIGGCKIGMALSAFRYNNNTWQEWIPNVALDFMGIDGYGTPGKKTAAAAFNTFLQAHPGPVVIMETNFVHDVGGEIGGTEAEQTAYIQSLDALCKANPRILGAAMWEGAQAYLLFPAALAALEAMSHDPFYGRTL